MMTTPWKFYGVHPTGRGHAIMAHSLDALFEDFESFFIGYPAPTPPTFADPCPVVNNWHPPSTITRGGLGSGRIRP